MEVDPRNAAQPRPTMSWEMLEKSLAHPNLLIREKALEMAGRWPDPRVLPALAIAVRDENPRLRATAAQALAQVAARRDRETDAALAVLIATGGDEELRVFLISNSGDGEGGARLRVVIECLVDVSPAIRTAAETALQKEAAAWTLSAAAGEALPVIEAARQSPDAAVRAAAGTWSEPLRRAQVRRTMLETGVAAILTLTAALRTGPAVLRVAAATALQKCGDTRALPALADALRDSSEDVRRAAAVALASAVWQAATEEEFAALLVALGRWPAATERGLAAVDALLLAATEARPETQVAAIGCLAELKSVRALRPLEVLLKQSPHAAVRRAAAAGLKLLEWVPVTGAQAVAQAVELEDWPGAASLGAVAVGPLLLALKAAHDRPGCGAQIAGALATLTDAGAVEALLVACRDGEVAAAAVGGLAGLIEHSAPEIPDLALRAMAELKNVMQFQFTMDPKYRQPARTGMEFVNVDGLHKQALAEITRRLETVSPQAVAPPEKERP